MDVSANPFVENSSAAVAKIASSLKMNFDRSFALYPPPLYYTYQPFGKPAPHLHSQEKLCLSLPIGPLNTEN